MLNHTPATRCGGLLLLALILTGCGDPSGSAPNGSHLRWHEDGGVDLVTLEDAEVIHLTRQELGSGFGKGRRPFAGASIAIAVAGQGPKGGISGPLHQLRPAWEQLSGAELEIVEIPVAELLHKTLTALRHGAGQLDGIMQGAWTMGEFVTPGLIRSVDAYIGDDRFPHWDPEWQPRALREIHKWSGETYGVLNDSDAHVLYWRHDILTDPKWQQAFRSDRGKDMPFPVKTWSDVAEIAGFFHGRDWDENDPDPDTGIVLHLKVNEQGMFHFMSLSSAFTVIGGDNVDRGTNNYWFDPDTMEPLINQPGHVRALETLVELARFGPKAQVAWDLGTAWDWFLRGKSVFIFSWGDVGALAQDESRSRIKGRVGASMLPGSLDVYDMNHKKWVILPEPNVVGNLVGASWHGVITAQSKHPEAVYSLLALMATRPVSLWNVNRGWTGVDPGATFHYIPPHGQADVQGYLDEGWNRSDLEFYLGAYYENFFAPTMLPFLRINGAEEYWRALDINLSETMIGRLEPWDALDRTAREWDQITDRRGRDKQLRQYQQSMGYGRDHP